MTVEELIAREQIRDALVRYTRGVDRYDMALIRSAFHEDARIQFPKSLHQGDAEGFFEFLRKELVRFQRTRHAITNTLIEFDGPEVAYVETYLHADHQGTEQHHWKTSMIELWRAISIVSRSATGCGRSLSARWWSTGCTSTRRKVGSTTIPMRRIRDATARIRSSSVERDSQDGR